MGFGTYTEGTEKSIFLFSRENHGIYKKSRYSLSSRVMSFSVLKVFFLVIKKKSSIEEF